MFVIIAPNYLKRKFEDSDPYTFKVVLKSGYNLGHLCMQAGP